MIKHHMHILSDLHADFGSDDGCAEIIRQYAEKDSRIVLVQAHNRFQSS